MIFYSFSQCFFFRIWKKDVRFFCVAGLVAGFDLNQSGALGSVEIDNGCAERAKA